MRLSGIGLAGCGRMGAPMLAALASAGFDARGFDIRDPAEFQNHPADIGDDAGRFAENLEILFTVVRDIEQTEEVLFGAQNLIGRARSLHTIVVCSTLSPRYLQNLKTRAPARIRLIDAPISGAAIAATEKRLSFMLGGDAETLKVLQPLFSAMGEHFHHMGAFGSGMSAKVLNNLLAASGTVMTRLVLNWAEQRGLAQDRLLQLIHTSSGQNWFASNFSQIEFARDGFEADNTIGILKKDVESALDAAPEEADTRLAELLIDLIESLNPI